LSDKQENKLNVVCGVHTVWPIGRWCLLSALVVRLSVYVYDTIRYMESLTCAEKVTDSQLHLARDLKGKEKTNTN